VIIRINPSDETPVYAQIVQQIKFGIASGTLRSGEQLPSVRELATQLRINPNTVARAYRELEYERLVATQKGRGVFVAMDAGRLPKAERLKLVTDKLDLLIHDAQRLGLSEEDLQELLARRLKAAQSSKSQEPQETEEPTWVKPSYEPKS